MRVNQIKTDLEVPKKISLLKKVWIILDYNVIFVVIYLNLSGGGVI